MITLKHQDSNVVKKCPTGFSWTTFFFGLFVPLIRGDFKWAAIVFVIFTVISVVTAGIGSLGVNIIFAFLYNKIYIRELMNKGFVPADETSQNWCATNGLLNVAH
ncbi:MAG: hypothetical protein IKZ58_10315 [Selenomonadaceae bacterium]|nr:hypothetical protein [Selenomonadaceae bacterium]